MSSFNSASSSVLRNHLFNYTLVFSIVGSLLISTSNTVFADNAFAKNISTDNRQVLAAQSETELDRSYARLLPLEGGSNFRDLGGYQTDSGKTVKRGLLFRSGVMSHLTKEDQKYLNRFGFKTIIDLRSQEELELFPNRWAKNANINYVHEPYSITQLITIEPGEAVPTSSHQQSYISAPIQIKPQLKQYFQQAIDGKAPLVINCAAGQDRTGISSALMLSALGVPRETIYKDYLLSTQYRLPDVERGTVDLKEAAKTNAFAALMNRYSGEERRTPQPLVSENGEPYLKIAFDEIERKYGGVENYLESELNVGNKELKVLRSRYLQ